MRSLRGVIASCYLVQGIKIRIRHVYGCIVTCIEKRRVVWFSEVWKVKKNGVVRECCNEDPSRGCV